MVTGTYLDSIGLFHRSRAAADTRRFSVDGVAPYDGPSFFEALRNDQSHVSVIAEVKRASPSKGPLAADLDAAALASLYAANGAAAISVLTDQAHFGAHATDLPDVAKAVTIPRLRKDFTVFENDIFDALAMGASAVLLIAALLDDRELERLSSLAHELQLSALFEIHDEEEASRVIDCGATIIGINQRNLTTFAVDPEHAARVVDRLPTSALRVCESGLRDVADIERAAAAGFDAVLVGETFVTSNNPAPLIRAFSSVVRQHIV